MFVIELHVASLCDFKRMKEIRSLGQLPCCPEEIPVAKFKINNCGVGVSAWERSVDKMLLLNTSGLCGFCQLLVHMLQIALPFRRP